MNTANVYEQASPDLTSKLASAVQDGNVLFPSYFVPCSPRLFSFMLSAVVTENASLASALVGKKVWALMCTDDRFQSCLDYAPAASNAVYGPLEFHFGGALFGVPIYVSNSDNYPDNLALASFTSSGDLRRHVGALVG